jgi:hypothetical protein
LKTLTEQEKRMFEFFMGEFVFCWACGAQEGFHSAKYTPGLIYPRWLDNHHIIGGASRLHFRWNLARLCGLCHDLFHGANVVLDLPGRSLEDRTLPNLTLANVCWLKQYHDPRWWKPEELSRIRLSSAEELEPERPPAWFEEEYGRRFNSKGYSRRA